MSIELNYNFTHIDTCIHTVQRVFFFSCIIMHSTYKTVCDIGLCDTKSIEEYTTYLTHLQALPTHSTAMYTNTGVKVVFVPHTDRTGFILSPGGKLPRV